MDRVSLIIPTHNEENIIHRSLNSLINQNINKIDNLEVIVVPNGCIDNTEKVVRDFIKINEDFKTVTWKVFPLNDGHRNRALNHGIQESSGEILMYLNPDCVLHKDSLQSVLSEFNQDPNLKVVGIFGKEDLTGMDKETLLYKTIMVLDHYREVVGTALPEGRFIAFKKGAFPNFPNNIHSEDTWISLYSYEKYGEDSIKVLSCLKNQ